MGWGLFAPSPLSLRRKGIRLKRKFAILILLFGLIFLANKAEALDITVTGDWSETINASDLISGAGSDLIGGYETASNAVSLSISGTTGTWRIDVKRVDSTWPGDLILYVKRTSDGTGSGSISGGQSYQEVTDTDLSFFSGNGDRSNVNVQLKLTGVSIQVPLDTYTTTVYYTVSDQ